MRSRESFDSNETSFVDVAKTHPSLIVDAFRASHTNRIAMKNVRLRGLDLKTPLRMSEVLRKEDRNYGYTDPAGRAEEKRNDTAGESTSEKKRAQESEAYR